MLYKLLKPDIFHLYSNYFFESIKEVWNNKNHTKRVVINLLINAVNIWREIGIINHWKSLIYKLRCYFVINKYERDRPFQICEDWETLWAEESWDKEKEGLELPWVSSLYTISSYSVRKKDLKCGLKMGKELIPIDVKDSRD